jgi:hypothetical protein
VRVSRCAVLINDLIRHPIHLALVYASFPIMRSRVAWVDGVSSVRRAYTPAEIRQILSAAFPDAAPQVQISRHYLFRMGVILWNSGARGLHQAESVADFSWSSQAQFPG